jgi:hypothetical protein
VAALNEYEFRGGCLDSKARKKVEKKIYGKREKRCILFRK